MCLFVIGHFLKVKHYRLVNALYKSVESRHTSRKGSENIVGLILDYPPELLYGECAFTIVAHSASRHKVVNIIFASKILSLDMVYLHVLVGYLTSTICAMAVVFGVDKLAGSFRYAHVFLWV